MEAQSPPVSAATAPGSAAGERDAAAAAAAGAPARSKPARPSRPRPKKVKVEAPASGAPDAGALEADAPPPATPADDDAGSRASDGEDNDAAGAGSGNDSGAESTRGDVDDDESSSDGSSKEDEDDEADDLGDGDDLDTSSFQHMPALTEEQLDRYTAFRRSTFPAAFIKKAMQSVTGQTPSDDVRMVVAGVTKVFVGEVVECALGVMDEWKDTGPIRPRHVFEAARRLREAGVMPGRTAVPPLFNRF